MDGGRHRAGAPGARRVTPRGPVRPWLPLAATSAALLTWRNVVVPALPPVPAVRAAANLAATAVLLVAARRGGMTWRLLGLSRGDAGAGARWGGAAFTVVAVGYGVALAVPALRDVLAGAAPDEAIGTTVLRVVLLVPVGTVLCEEFAFRAVLHGLALRVLPPGTAVGVVSAVFGLWHVGSASVPPGSPGSPTGEVVPVIGVVLGTALGGLVFGWLRHRSGSLLAPIGLHLGTNGLGLLASTAAARLTAG